jgi:hypothetical protein
MKKTLLAAALALTAIPAFASDEAMGAAPADLAAGTMLGTDTAAITEALTALGYDVRKVGSDDGMLEAYVVKDRYMAEVYINPKTGEIVRVGGDD